MVWDGVDVTGGSELVPEGVDLDRPNAARIYDYLLGGTANWAIDRVFGDEAIKNLPIVRTLAQINREFLGRAVAYCARQGVTQFLDIGSGVPTVGNVHEVADEARPGTRCVYVDIEPVAVAHSRVLLEKHGDPSRHAVVQADMADVETVWQAALDSRVLDPERPIALLMVALLHFVPPERKAHAAVEAYRELLPPGSHLVISHATDAGVPDDLLDQLHVLAAQYEKSSTPVCFRTPEEIAAFFGDFAVVDPGLVWLPQWRVAERDSEATAELLDTPARSCVLGAVGRKPTG